MPGPTASGAFPAAQTAETAAIQNAVWSFVAQLAATSGAGAVPATACRCAVSVALALHGNASATGTGGSAGSADGATGGSTGPALSVSVSGKGSASATATSGTVGGAGSAGPGSNAPVSISPSENAGALTGEVRGLVGSLVAANQSATTLDSVTTASFTQGWSAHGAVSTQISFATTSPVASLGECLRLAQGPSGDRCVIAISVSVGGTAHAAVSPGSGVPTAGCAAGSPALAGASAAVAIAADGDALAAAKRGDDASGCDTSPAVAPSSGATGAAVGVALTASGSAASTATSGNSGRATAHGANNGGIQADADTGRTGDAIGVAIAKIGAIAVVRSGNSGTALASCVGCTISTLPSGGSAIATATSGATGSSYALAVAGLSATVNTQSGNTGDATSLIGIDPAAAPTAGTGVAAIGRSGTTGDVVAVAVSVDSSVTITTQSGLSGGVVSTALEGAVCASPAADAVITCAAPPSDDPAAPPAPQSTVGASGPGHAVITVGTTTHQQDFPALPGTSSVTDTPNSSTDPVVSVGAAAVFIGPKYHALRDAAHVEQRSIAAKKAAARQTATFAPLVFGSGLIVLAFVLMIAAVTRRRKARRMRRS